MSNRAENKRHYYLAYSMPVVASTWLMAPIGVLQGIYAKYFGLSLSTIASVILVSRLFDAVSDPLVGFYSDYYYRRIGTRKPFIVVGGALFVISSYFLYVPVDIELLAKSGSAFLPKDVSATYFAFWFIVFYMSSTLFEIPHLTWAGDIAPMANEKAKIYSYRSVAGYLGLLVFYTIPMLPIFETTEITPASLQVSVFTAGSCMLMFLIGCSKFVPDRLNIKRHFNVKAEFTGGPPYKKLNYDKTGLNDIPESRNFTLKNTSALVKSMSSNRPFILFISAYSLTTFSTGMWYGLLFIYIDGYLNLGEHFALTFLAASIAGILATPLWCHLAIRLGKKVVWAAVIALVIGGFIYTGTMKPGTTDVINLVVLQVAVAGGFSCISIIAPAMVSEIADYGTWQSGVERPASYFSLFTFTHKTTSAISSALGLFIAGWYGFDAVTGIQSDRGVFGIILAISWIPIFVSVLSLFFIFMTPISDRRHAVIRKRLDDKARRSVMVENLSAA